MSPANNAHTGPTGRTGLFIFVDIYTLILVPMRGKQLNVALSSAANNAAALRAHRITQGAQDNFLR